MDDLTDLLELAPTYMYMYMYTYMYMYIEYKELLARWLCS